MPWSPRAVLLRDLVLGILGTLAFLIDLGADVWAASQYVLSGRYLWAALVLALLGLASVALQLFSWVWLRSDVSIPLAPKPPGRFLALLHLLQLGYLYSSLHCWQTPCTHGTDTTLRKTRQGFQLQWRFTSVQLSPSVRYDFSPLCSSHSLFLGMAYPGPEWEKESL